MQIKLIIFDLDGTLVDTSGDITNALNYALKPYGLRDLTVEDTIKMVGEGITRLIEKLLENERIQMRDTVIKRFLDYYSEHLVDFSTLYPHVRETLEKLNDYKKAVISNKREYLSTRLLDKLDLLKYFDLVVGSDTTSERKPSAIPVIYVFTKLGVNPNESIIVGDSNYDIEAGKKAGLKTVAVTYGYRERQYLIDADYIIDSMKDLLTLLDTNSYKFL
ncbi:MAG: HAD-IA family hydrolase [Nitrospirota bacterium]|jgi:phosphoglycolate phosphatase|nr:HAD-IA family hydrolase [Nitrospirota bacterium]